MSVEATSRTKILLLGGQPHEVIDGVRHYANHNRPNTYALAAAKQLAELGAEVTLVNTNLHGKTADGITIKDRDSNGNSIENTQQLLAAAKEQAASGFDAIVNLATIPAIKPAQTSDKKLKVKKEAGALVPMEVVGNIDVESALHALAKKTPVAGFNERQEWFGDDEITNPIRTIAENAPLYKAKTPAPTAAVTRINGKLSGRTIVMTSGPTAEPLSSHGDLISNFSTGTQGYAIAESLAQMGAKVVLVSGPTHLPEPSHPAITTIHVESARQMRDEVLKQLPADAYIGVAAVADFGMAKPGALHLQPNEPVTLQLSQNPDILQTVGTHPTLRPPVVIGFAAETHDLLTYAKGKLEKKGADAICANQVGNAIAQRGIKNNQITWVTANSNEPWEVMDKHEVGSRIGDKIALLLQRSRAPGSSAPSGGNLGIF